VVADTLGSGNGYVRKWQRIPWEVILDTLGSGSGYFWELVADTLGSGKLPGCKIIPNEKLIYLQQW